MQVEWTGLTVSFGAAQGGALGPRLRRWAVVRSKLPIWDTGLVDALLVLGQGAIPWSKLRIYHCSPGLL